MNFKDEKTLVTEKCGICYFYTTAENVMFNVLREHIPAQVRAFVNACRFIIANSAFEMIRFRYSDYEITIARRDNGYYNYKLWYKKLH